MSWHFLQEREAVSSADICWDGGAFVPSKSTTMLGGYCLPDNETECSPTSPSGMTLRRLTEGPGAGGLMWFQGDSPVRTYRPPEREQDLAEAEADCGPSLPESLARYNPATYSWRTRQYSLLGGLELFSETWPRWGMMRGGELSVPAMLAPRTSESGSGLWPTPCAMEPKKDLEKHAAKRALPRSAGGGGNAPNLATVVAARAMWQTPVADDVVERVNGKVNSRGEPKLSAQVKLWPTPMAGAETWSAQGGIQLCQAVKRFRTPNKTDADKWGKQSQAEREAKGQQVRLCHQLDAGGSLSPVWVEWLMGWPLGWTDLGVLEMDRFQQWRQAHGGN